MYMYGYILDPNNQQGDDSSEEPRIVKEFHSVSMLRSGSKEVLKSLDASDLARRRMSSPDNSISRQLSRSGSPEEETLVKHHMYDEKVDGNNIKNDQYLMNESAHSMNEHSKDYAQSFSMNQNEGRDFEQSERNSISEPKAVNESRQPTNQRHSLDGSNVNRVNNLFIQNAPMNDKSTNRSFDGALPQGGRHSSRPTMDGYRYNAEDDAESETDVKKRLSSASSQMSRREESEGQRPNPQPVYQRQGILV